MARIILARVDSGQTVAEVLADPAMPSRRTLYDWIRDKPDFGAAWDEMRRDRAWSRRTEIARLAEGVRRWEAIRARANGRRPRRKVGRKSTFRAERGHAFCALIAKGYIVGEAAQEMSLSGVPIIYRWLRNHPRFRAG